MKKPLQLENLKPSLLEFRLVELNYILVGKPREKNLLHKIFQHFHQDVLLATKLADAILKYENPNDLDRDHWTALHVAVRFNQIKAVKYAQQSGRFDFHQLGGVQEFSLMHLAVSKSNYEIIEILIEEKVSMFQENNEGVLPRKLALQSPTNLKMIKKYENLQIMRFLVDLEDIEEEECTKTNVIKNLNISQQSIKISEANDVLLTRPKVSMTYHQQTFHIQYLECEKFIDNALNKIFEGDDIKSFIKVCYY